jgi:PAS domain S-box-containing protein
MSESGQAQSAPATCGLVGGGAMGDLIRAMDWSSRPLGPIETWPPTLRTAVNICLGSRHPIVLWWGPERTMFYNDGYRPMLGAGKHPQFLGGSGQECWAEIWDIIGPMMDQVVTTGEATWSEDMFLLMFRSGYYEETYFTFSYSPIRDETGIPRGIFNACTETTSRVLGERRMKTLRELVVQARTAAEAARLCCGILGSNPKDIPFALIYLLDEAGAVLNLEGAAGLPAGLEASPRAVALAGPAPAGWPLARVMAEGQPERVLNLEGTFEDLPAEPWGEPAHQAMVLPMARPGMDRPTGVLVLGISPRRAFDESYQGFFQLLAGHIATTVANARAYEEEKARAEKLAELDRAKTAFFSNVSHEFRTPLTLILGPLADALAEPGLTPAQREPLRAAHRNSLRLLKLVNTLLDFARIEAGRVQALFEPTDLATLTAELAGSFRSACERAGLRLEVDCPPLPEPVYVDRDMWEKIVLNLVSNAFKFTLRGAIGISLEPRGDAVALVVRDTGAGIPAEALPRIFERFHQVKGTQGRSHEGTGIGLALVRELVALHGGAITAESAPGAGSRFTVTLPRGSAHLPAERTGTSRAPAAGPGAESYLAEALRWLPSAAPEPAPADGPGRPRIIWADDNADLRDYVLRLLGDRYQVEALADGWEALAAARRQAPDLVLADIMMPRLDGFGLLRELRAQEATRTVPVVLLSARAGEEARVEGLTAGADAYLVKPFAAHELQAVVAAQIDRARQFRQVNEILEQRIAERTRELMQEVRERREVEQRLRELSQRLTYHVDHSPLAVIEWGPDMRLTRWSGEAERIFGWSAGEVLGKRIEDFRWVYPEDQELVTEVSEELQTGANPRRFSANRNYRKDGSVVHCEWYNSSLLDDAGQFRSILSLVLDVTERKRMEAALREEARRKDDFLAVLGHELRNPLAPIHNAAHLMRQAGRNPALIEPACAIIERQVTQLTRLVDDLLDLSRIARGKVQLSQTPMELVETVGTVIEDYRPVLEQNGLALETDLPAAPIPMEADRARIIQAVSNLVHNAIKFTDPGGRVRITVALDGGWGCVRVRDSGAGIPPEQLGTIFEPFTQSMETVGRSRKGLGLGLTLAKGLAELHGGTLAARSDGPGRGSEFTLRLPALQAAAAAEAPAQAAAPFRPRRILIVEDVPDAATTLQMVLRMLGHTAEVAGDGRSALALAASFGPEIILCDIGLPGELDGYGVARTLRATPGLPDMHLIALTGFGTPEDKARALQAGFDGHLTKPVDPAALGPMIADLA